MNVSISNSTNFNTYPFFPVPDIAWLYNDKVLNVSTIPLLAVVTVVCLWNDNYTQDYGEVSHFHIFEDGVDNFVTDGIKYATLASPGNITFYCQAAVKTDTLFHTNYSEELLLDFEEMCKNGGFGYLNDSGVFCICSTYYVGRFCEVIKSEAMALALEVSDEGGAVNAVKDIFTKATGFVTEGGADRTSSSAQVVNILADKLTSVSSWSQATLVSVTENILDFVGTTFETVRDNQPKGSREVYDKIEESMFSISASILNSKNGSSSGSGSMELTTGNITLNMNTLLVGKPVLEAAGARIEVPDNGVTNQALAITYETSPYPATSSDPDGRIVNFRIKNVDGTLLNITSDPVILSLKPAANKNTLNTTTSSSYNVSVETVGPQLIFVLETNASADATILIQVKMDGEPRSNDADVVVRVTRDEVRETINALNLQFVVDSGDTTISIRMYGQDLASNGSYLIVFLKDESGQSEKLDIETYTVYPVYWNNTHESWRQSEDTAAVGLEENSGLTFTSNLFGSFSVSRFFIAPEPIDFEEVFGNFSDNLLESPYVLAVICFILFGFIIGILLLRRMDMHDQWLWTYLPLVDNDPVDKWIYTISVHTSVDSPRVMSSIPFFVMHGEFFNSGPRILHDGVRKNFQSGTVSNFVMTSPQSLGELVMIKIWMDGEGDHPDWCLDRIIIVDKATSSRYIFSCQDWFSLLRGGTLCHSLPPVSKETLSSGGGIVSKQRLYDEHMWLSLIKRPSYSTFTRVQRLVVATALLSLAMLTNAMFFQIPEDNDSKPVGLRLGHVTISYKQVYVGIVSGIIIVVPSLILTWVFTNTHQRDARNHTVEKESVLESGITPVEVVGKHEEKLKALKMDSGTKNPTKMMTLISSITYFGTDRPKTLPEKSGRPKKIRLPWWFIFVGYSFAGCLMALGLVFTFLYSLQWGGSKSLEWLISLVFSTSSSTFIFEPLKIILLCWIVSHVFGRLIASHLGHVAPYDNKPHLLCPLAERPPICPPLEMNSDFFAKRKRDMKLRQRFYETINSIGFRTLMVLLFGIICVHSDVCTSFRENKFAFQVMNETYVNENINFLGDVWPWLNDMVIPKSFPTSYVNEDPLATEQKQFTDDLTHYRLGPLRLVQYRVQDKCSHDPGDVNSHFSNYSCWVDYCEDNEEDGQFGAKWTSCTSDCHAHFKYTVSNTHCLSVSGEAATYGPNGYEVLLENDQVNALSTVSSLKTNEWLDHLTRGVLVTLMTFNPNTRLFTQVKVLLETPSFGGLIQTTSARSARLYPYITVWDYFILLAQGIVIIIVVARTVMLISVCVQTKGKCIRQSTLVVSSLELILSWLAIGVYVARIHFTMVVLERIVNQPGEFTSFDLVFTLDFIYLVCISFVLFLRMLMFLEPLKLNFHFYLMRQTIRASLPQLGGFAILLTVALTAFASFFFLCQGKATSNMRTIPHSYVSLLTVLLGHGKYKIVGGQEKGAGSPVGEEEILFRVMYGLFCVSAALCMVNVAVTILTFYMSEVASQTASSSLGKGGYDKNLNEYLWNRIDAFINTVFPSMKKQTSPPTWMPQEKKDDSKQIDSSASPENGTYPVDDNISQKAGDIATSAKVTSPNGENTSGYIAGNLKSIRNTVKFYNKVSRRTEKPSESVKNTSKATATTLETAYLPKSVHNTPKNDVGTKKAVNTTTTSASLLQSIHLAKSAYSPQPPKSTKAVLKKNTAISTKETLKSANDTVKSAINTAKSDKYIK